MNEDINTELASTGVHLLDDAYLAWFSAESESEHALRAWGQAGATDRVAAYTVYLAAMDREEAAARDLQRLARA